MKLQPLPTRIVLKRDEPEKEIGGIVIPEQAQGQEITCTVVATYEETEDQKPLVKVGDRVLVGRYPGSDFELENEKVLLVNEEDIMAIIKEEKK